MSAQHFLTAAIVVSMALIAIGLSKWSASRIEDKFSDAAPAMRTYRWNSWDTICIALVGIAGAVVIVAFGGPV